MTKRVEEGREWVEEEREGVKEKREGVEEGEGAPGWSRGLILSLGYLHVVIGPSYLFKFFGQLFLLSWVSSHLNLLC